MSFTKYLALKSISLGARPPESSVDRYLELVHLKALLASLRVNCLLDVGANTGQFAREARAIGYQQRLVSFEPLGGEFAALSSAFAHDPQWRGYRCALGRERSTKRINVPRMSVFSSFLQAVEPESNVRQEEVEVRRLDEIMPEIVADLAEPRVFLKMDTQGYDLEVFGGAAACMNRVVGLQSELSVHPIYVGMPDYHEALGVYKSAGFDLYNVSVVNRLDDGALLELNCFMRKR